MSAYSKVSELYSKYHSLGSISGILGWDSRTMMPVGSMKYRAEDSAVLERIANKILTSNRLGDLLAEVSESDCSEWEKANIRSIKRERGNVLAVDPEIAEQLTKASMECEVKWRVARKNNDFKEILPELSRVIELVREVSKSRMEYFNCGQYDSLLELYDPGRKVSEVEHVVNSLKGFLPEFIQKVLEKQKSWKILKIEGEFPEEKQRELGVHCMNAIGFDFNRGRLDISAHPFCGGATQDVRITTRYNKHEFLSSLMGVMHETGHALYQQNLPETYYNQAVGGNLGMSIHESQSLFVEIQVSRSKEFMEFVLPKIKSIFNVSGPRYSADNLYKIANKVETSLIRVDSDEITYLAHVILRFELEKEILSGNLKIKDLPTAWNEKMKKYLGIKPRTDSDGCMQDIHWFAGWFGYFPTYMLGTMLASQFFTTMKSEVPDVEKHIQTGEFQPITGWLKKNIHSQGSLHSVSDLVKKVTKKDLDVEGYKKYLTEKFL